MDDGAAKPPSESRYSSSMWFRPFGAIVVATLLFIVPQILVGIVYVSILLAQGVSVDDTSRGESIGENFALYLVAELLTLAGFFLVLKAKNKHLSDYGLTFRGISSIWKALPAYVIYLIATIVVQSIAALFLSEDVINAKQNIGFEAATQTWELVLAFVALVLIAPFVEEVLFRGYLFKEMRTDWSFPLSALVTAGLFGLAHLQINVGLDTFVLALPLAYLIEKTRSLSAPIALHMLKNLIAYVSIFLLDFDETVSAITNLFS